MARIRSIKPTFFRDIAMSELPLQTRYTYIGLWTYLDDNGVGVDDARLVKAEIYPLDDAITAKKVEDDLGRLAAAGRIVRYMVDGRRYLAVPRWTKHQKVNRPSPSPFPPPPLTEDAGSLHDTDPDDSPPEGERVEGEGLGKGNSSSSELSRDNAHGDDDERILDHAIAILAQRRLTRSRTPIDNPAAWLHATRTDLAKQLAGDQHQPRPGETADQLADRLDTHIPGLPETRAHTATPGPAAERECPTCGNPGCGGWLPDTSPAVRCPEWAGRRLRAVR